MRMPTRSKPRRQLSPEMFNGLRDDARRIFGFALDPALLDADEQSELLRLYEQARPRSDGGKRGDGIVWSRLDKSERARFEHLLEQAAGAEGHFDRSREQAKMRKRLRELQRRVVRLSPPTPEAEIGLLQEIAAHVQGDYLHPEHVLALVLVLAALYRGEGLAPHSRIERDGDGEAVLVLDRDFGLLRADRNGRELRLGPLEPTLRHLEANSWLVVTAKSRELRIRLGTRATRVLRLTPTKAAS